MKTLWSIVLVLAACGGGKSDQATTPADPGASPAPPTAPAGDTAPAAAAPVATSSTAAADAAKLNDEGKQAMFANKYEDGAVKFRAAIALDPKPLYSFNLCVAEYSLGKFGDAKRACKTAAATPEAPLAEKATKMLAKIDAEAQKQGIALPP